MATFDTATAAERGSLIVDEVTRLRASSPALPLLELFDQVMEGRTGAEVEFEYRPEQVRWVAFGELLVNALCPYTVEERRVMEHGTPDEVNHFFQDDEHRPLHAISLFELRYELNGVQGRDAWAADFTARVLELRPSADQREVHALGRTLWSDGHWQMGPRACAEWHCRQ